MAERGGFYMRTVNISELVTINAKRVYSATASSIESVSSFHILRSGQADASS